MNLAFLGLGKMGSGMARNLIRAGHKIAVYNRSREKAEPFAKEGARVADSPADACRDAEVVLSMVADDSAVEHMVFGKDGIFAAAKPGLLHISHSTISTALARKLATEHEQHQVGYLSAPVFGRPEAAEGKKLLVIVAGDAKWIDRARQLLDAVGRQTFVVGPEPWQANAVKLCGNFTIMSMIEAFSEAFATLRKAGVAPGEFLNIMDTLYSSPVVANYGRTIVEEKFDPAGFALKLGLKDMRLALATAEECGSPMPLASLVHDHLLAGVAQGQGDLDWSSVARVVARSAGL